MKKEKLLREAVAHDVAWERGVGYEFECDAIISAWLLEMLVKLASHAPRHLVEDLIAHIDEPEVEATA
jgi:hypothetical protein